MKSLPIMPFTQLLSILCGKKSRLYLLVDFCFHWHIAPKVSILMSSQTIILFYLFLDIYFIILIEDTPSSNIHHPYLNADEYITKFLVVSIGGKFKFFCFIHLNYYLIRNMLRLGYAWVIGLLLGCFLLNFSRKPHEENVVNRRVDHTSPASHKSPIDHAVAHHKPFFHHWISGAESVQWEIEVCPKLVQLVFLRGIVFAKKPNIFIVYKVKNKSIR